MEVERQSWILKANSASVVVGLAVILLGATKCKAYQASLHYTQ